MGHSRSVTRSERDWTARYRGLVIKSTKFMHFHVPMLRGEEDHDRGHAEMRGRGGYNRKGKNFCNLFC